MKLAILGIGAVWATMASAVTLSVQLDREDAVYSCGAEAVFKVKATAAPGESLAGTVEARLDNYGKRLISTRQLDLATASEFQVRGTLAKPGFLRLTLKGAGTNLVWSAAFEPTKIKQGGPDPADFDEFWARAIADYDRTVPADIRLEKLEQYSNAKREFFLVSLPTVGNRQAYAFLTIPTDRSKGPFKTRVNVPGAGPVEWTNGGGANDVSLAIQVHYYRPVPGLAKNDPKNNELLKQHEENDYLAKYGTKRYCNSGISESREAYHYYGIIMAAQRLVNWLYAEPYVDKSQFVYGGTSQGGGFGLILAGLTQKFVKVQVNVPALTDTLGYLDDERQSGWPRLIENQRAENREAALRNAPYFDGANFAARIRCPIRVVVGFADPSCAPGAVYAGFNRIPAQDKQILNGIGMTHSCYRELVGPVSKWLMEPLAK